VRETFIAGTEPRRACDWHRDGEVAWPRELVAWAARRRHAGGQTP
jgi:hypothetical protein